MKRFTYIDLFAGAGGFSEGFYKAGFLPVAHVEMDKNACDTLKTRISYYYLKSKNKLQIYYSYLNGVIDRETFYSYIPTNEFHSVINERIDAGSIKSIFKKIDDNLGGRKVDVIIGGPPCQAYSVVGRSRDPNRMKEDHRNYLFVFYAEFLKKYQPKYFVFENVPGITSAQNYFDLMIDLFQSTDIGYKVDHRTFDMSHYGVLQSRERVIIIGKKGNNDFFLPELKKIQRNWSIANDLFSDLPPIIGGEENGTVKYKTKPTRYLKKFKFRDRVSFVTLHTARSHNPNDLKIYKIAIKKWLIKRERLQYSKLPVLLKTHKNHNTFQDRYKVVDPFGLSHTIVAHIAKDGNYYIHPDIKQLRSISVREAARIQSFPDNYYFEGSRSSRFKQIGNALPPIFAEILATKIKYELWQ